MAAYKNLLLLFLLLFSLFSSQIAAQIKVPPAPKPARYMVDFADMLTPEEAQSIEDKLYRYFQAKQAQIVIVTVVSLDGSSIEEYAEALFRKWGIGGKKRNDGLLLLISKNDRKMRIEVGYELEGTITDAFASQVIDNDLKPSFKNSYFYEGMDNAMNTIIQKLSPDYVIPPTIIDAERAARKQKEDEEARKRQAEDEIYFAEIEKKAASNRRTTIIVVAILFGVFMLIYFIVRGIRKNEALKKEKSLYRIILAALQPLKQSEAYRDNSDVRNFMDGYEDKLNEFSRNLQTRDITKKANLIKAEQTMFQAYKSFIECYEKTCVAANLSPDTYYAAEILRVTEANKAEMAKISAPNIIATSHGKSIIANVAANLHQAKLSFYIDNQLDALTACPDESQKAFEIIFPIVKAFEDSEHFRQLIEKQPQAQAFLDEKAEIIRTFAQKICDICTACHAAASIIDTIAITNDTPMELKNAFVYAITTYTYTILLKFDHPNLLQNAQPNYTLIKTLLDNPEINKLVADLQLTFYTKPFQSLSDKIKTFAATENLLTQYSSRYTAASILALHNALSKDTTDIQFSFTAGNHRDAFLSLLQIFNGIFPTSTYLNKYLVAIATASPSRTYSRSSVSGSASSYSDSSDYKSSYSDYSDSKPAYSDYSDYSDSKPAYSDYSDYSDSKPAYSDYSDYSDSSYGGGSSGGGGASGSW